VLGHFRDIVNKILDSPKLIKALECVCVSLNVKKRLPELEVPTRWNSTWEMLVGVIALQKPLEELLRRIRYRHEGFTGFSIAPRDHLAQEVPSMHWSAVQDFCNFLKKFADATRMLSGSLYPTLGLVIPVWQVLTNHCVTTIAASNGFRSAYGQRFATAVHRKLNEYNALIRSEIAIIAGALDPRSKSMPKCGYSLSELQSMIEDIWTSEYKSRYNSVRERDGTNSEIVQSIDTGDIFYLSW
jgi:hypothetical protein